MVAIGQRVHSINQGALLLFHNIKENITVLVVIVLAMGLLAALDYNNALETKIQIDHIRYDSRIMSLEIKADTLEVKLEDHIRDVQSNINDRENKSRTAYKANDYGTK